MLKKLSLIAFASQVVLSSAFGATLSEMAEEFSRIKADDVLPGGSIVQFVLPAVSGDKILMNVAYIGTGKGKEIRDMHFFLSEPRQEGTYPYELAAQQGRKIRLIFHFEKGEYSWSKIETDFSFEDAATGETILTVTSLGGYKINFKFSRKDSQVTSVQVYPEINPYSEVDQDPDA